jgi:hypothetical protein
MIKKFLFLILILPLTLFAQYDFDTRYFTINANSLPEAPTLNAAPLTLDMPIENKATFTLDQIPTFNETLNSFRISASNYREPVDMMSVLNTKSNYVDKTLDIVPVDSNRFGFSGYNADKSSKVKNTVYTEVSGLDLLSPCPPYGICPRCAPYRTNRGY